MTVAINNEKDQAVSHQYDSDAATQFYQIVMGDGGADIHYGIYEKSSDSALKASANTVMTIYELAENGGVKFDSRTKVLDSGAGNGGSAHKIVERSGAHVTCLNICEGQNKENWRQVSKLGIEDKIDIVTGSFDKLPEEWTDSFDVIWSQDAFVHSQNKKDVISEAFRVLKPGGHLVFTDIMASALCTQDDLEYFKNRLHVDDVYTPKQYEKEMSYAGFDVLKSRDLTSHLTFNYRKMVERAHTERSKLDKCSDEYLKVYTDNLKKNISILTEREAQCWFAMLAQKPHFESTDLKKSSGFNVPKNMSVMKRYVTTKLHNIAVTDKSVIYHGSVSICRNLMRKVGIEEFEAVDVVNLRNGARWTTYALPIDEDGAFTLNGGGARLGEIGDECVIMTFGISESYVPAYVICCDAKKNNTIIDEFKYIQP